MKNLCNTASLRVESGAILGVRMGPNVRIGDETSTPVDAELAELARKQLGSVTRTQLHQLGLGHRSIAHRIKAGRLHRVHRGVYAVGRPPSTVLERASAAVLACGPGAALSHSSAMALWGFWKRWDHPFEVTVPADRRPSGLKTHHVRALTRRDLRVQLGIRVTSPAQTVLHISPRLDDASLTRTVRNALVSPWLNESDLEDLLARSAGVPGAARIAKLIGLPGTPTRSGWEDDFPAFCRAHGLPTPVMGATVCGYVVDALFPAEKVIVELDGWEFHQGKIAFERDRERDAVTLAAGFVTVRITWQRLHGRATAEATRLRAIVQARRKRAA